MYQFSLDSYITLFNLSIEKSPKSGRLEERINNLNEYHTYAVYRYVTLSLSIVSYGLEQRLTNLFCTTGIHVEVYSRSTSYYSHYICV